MRISMSRVGYCGAGEETQLITAPTLDNPRCRVGSICRPAVLFDDFSLAYVAGNVLAAVVVLSLTLEGRLPARAVVERAGDDQRFVYVRLPESVQRWDLEEMRLDIPIPFGNVNYVSAAFPRLQPPLLAHQRTNVLRLQRVEPASLGQLFRAHPAQAMPAAVDD